jgi:translation initiation factor 1
MDSDSDRFDIDDSGATNIIHIRNQKRNGKKSVTTIQGIPDKFDLERIVRYFKKEFSCNGTVMSDPVHGEIIQLQGDKRKEVAEFLYHEGIAEKETIKVHGA